MTSLNIQIIETLVVIIVFIIARLAARKMINKAGVRYDYQKSSIKISKRIVGVILFILTLVTLLMIWSVDQSDLIFFISSALTVMGIALFAQWSILSNITSGLIIYLNHSVKVGDVISIIDKDYEIEGRVTSIGIFLLTLNTIEGDEITVPCNLFVQKMIKKKSSANSVGNTWIKN